MFLGEIVMHIKTKAVIPSRRSARGVPGEDDTQTHHSDMFSTVILPHGFNGVLCGIFYSFQ